MKPLLKSFLERTPYIKNLYQRINQQGKYPAGHYYSPIPDKDEVLEYIESRKPLRMELPDVKLNKEKQFDLLNDYVKFYNELPFPENKNTGYRYYYNNKLFSYSDAIFLYCFLRRHLPKRIIEIGAGFSSAVILDTVDLFFSSRPEMTFIDPYSDRLNKLIRCNDENYIKIINKKIQQVPSELFLTLEAGDFLFIDSSHVLKCGSDLQMLMFEILPLLPSGIFVHFHDVFYPFDYPPEWLKKGIYWNESYFLRAFLSFNHDWSVYFFNTYVIIAFYHFIKNKMPLCLRHSKENMYGSLYIQREKKG